MINIIDNQQDSDNYQSIVRNLGKSRAGVPLFLSDDEIIKIGEDIPAALLTIPSLVVLSIDGGEPLAFMGIDGKKLEMLLYRRANKGKDWQNVGSNRHPTLRSRQSGRERTESAGVLFL